MSTERDTKQNDYYIGHAGVEKGDWLMFAGGDSVKIGEVIHIEWWTPERDHARFYTTAGVADKILRVKKGCGFVFREEPRTEEASEAIETLEAIERELRLLIDKVSKGHGVRFGKKNATALVAGAAYRIAQEEFPEVVSPSVF